MKATIFIITLFPVFIACTGQNKPKKEISGTNQYEAIKGTNPKVNIKVNKQYDSKGNLIKYDSTYSFYKTAKGRDSVKVHIDSVFGNFKSYYHDQFSQHLDKQFDNLFFSDSLFKYDFLNEDYFKKRFELNMKTFDQMFSEMDSIKLYYLNKSNPGYPIRKKKTGM